MVRADTALLTVAETADRLGLPRMVVYRLVHSGDLPSVGVGHAIRVPATALQVASRAARGAEVPARGARAPVR
jgi:excisionase family DNA binding protein